MGSAYFDAHSLWQQDEKPLFRTLAENLNTEVCVVGAGIAGLTVAYTLAKAGHRVVVLDRERLGLGETGLTSAHLSNALDEHYFALERLHGARGARLAAESHTAAIDTIERIVRDENIDCEFRRLDGYLFLSPDQNLDLLTRELAATHRAGLTDTELLPQAPVPFFDSGPCVRFPRQATFHPIKYINGLSDAVERLGGRIFTHSEVTEAKGGRPAKVTTAAGFTVECDAVVVATNAPINGGMTIHAKNAAYRSYLIGVHVPPEVARNVLLWDTAEPYHYVNFVKAPVTGRDILLVGGEDHRTGQDTSPENHFRRLADWVGQRLGVEPKVVSRWSGQIMEPVDGLAYIGRNPKDPDNVFIVTGDSGHGLTHGTIAGIMIPELIAGRGHPWHSLYDPSRLHVRSLGTLIKEAVQSSAPYKDWLAEGDVASAFDIPAGEGAVVREGLRKVAVYKDDGGRLHSCSAVCPHLGGIVRWNGAEKTWDCPCHGSRFDRFGQVINGPAKTELAPHGDPRELSGEALTT